MYSCWIYFLPGVWTLCSQVSKAFWFGDFYDAGYSDDRIVQQTKLWRIFMSFAPSWRVQSPHVTLEQNLKWFLMVSIVLFFRKEWAALNGQVKVSQCTDDRFVVFIGLTQWWAHSSAEKSWRIIFRSYLTCHRSPSCSRCVCETL